MLVVVISGDKLVRATELVKLLSLEKSVKGAIKLVTALKLPNLAERFNNILEVSFSIIWERFVLFIRVDEIVIMLCYLPTGKDA